MLSRKGERQRAIPFLEEAQSIYHHSEPPHDYRT